MDEPARQIGVYSRRLLAIPALAAFLEPWGVPVRAEAHRWRRGELAAIAGWGHRPTAQRARDEAARRGLPYLALEDGFLRSAGLGVAGAEPWSLIVDDVGVYYDASAPSRLEQLIAAQAQAPPAPSALVLLDLVRSSGLTKYNVEGSGSAGDASARPVVYVLDQTRGDISVSAGGCDAWTFEAMLDAALRETVDAEVVVRAHPDVVAGRRRGYLVDIARRRGVAIDSSLANWPALAARALRVYTATSLGGFEALVAGAPVTCFGVPFYAGWNLTEDRRPCARRTARPTVEQVFAAAYGEYARYIDPVHGHACDGHVMARRILAARGGARSRRLRVLGVQRWKRPLLRPALHNEAMSVRFIGAGRAPIAQTALADADLAVWASRASDTLIEAAERAGVALLHVEDGFIRSAGLGSDFRPALSLVLDDLGVYFDVRRESRLERILGETAFSPQMLARAAALRQRLIAERVSKYNLGAGEAFPGASAGRRVVLVPGQVETDASIRCSAPEIARNLDLLAAVRQARPDAMILYKPHPEVANGHRSGAVARAAALKHADVLLDGLDPTSAIDAADEVHTMTSLLGFEALLRGRSVWTYGLPFYAGLGLTTDRLTWPRSRRAVSLDALVAATLLLYPRYTDPRTHLPIAAEDALDILKRTPAVGADRLLGLRRLARWAALTMRG